MKKPIIKFVKLNDKAIIPSKRKEDAGYDVYGCFEGTIIINPNETRLIPTGIASSCPNDYCFILKERSSIGSKGIALRCGVIDSGYRGEWHVALTNTTNKTVVLYENDWDKIKDDTAIQIPITKAICQVLLIPVINAEIVVCDDVLDLEESERGIGGFGSTGK